jgi:hypothetical protein
MERNTAGTMSGTRRFEDYQDTYKGDFESRYGKNKPWDEHRYAYRYGWESAQDDRWQGKEFTHAESDLKSGWHDFNSKHMHGSDMRNEHKDHSMDQHKTAGGKAEHVWDNFKDTVKEGWDRARMGF